MLRLVAAVLVARTATTQPPMAATMRTMVTTTVTMAAKRGRNTKTATLLAATAATATKITKPLQLVVGVASKGKHPNENLPKFAKQDSGEDAFFVLPADKAVNTAKGVVAVSAMGVADGVGGAGPVSAYAAWGLMNRAMDYAKAHPDVTPKEILVESYNKLLKDNVAESGSTTACIGTFNGKTGVLRTVNLGDSGYVLIRENRVLFRSKEQQHQYNTPYQLSLDKYGDNPQVGDENEHMMADGDVIVMATDGLFDNMFDDYIASVVRVHMKSHEKRGALWPESLQMDLDGVARDLVNISRAIFTATDGRTRIKTPWNSDYGKMDDVTVLVGMVKPAAE